MADPADWALKEAIKRCNCAITLVTVKASGRKFRPAMFALADMIEKYESPPVDPDLIRARNLYVVVYCHSDYTRTKALNGGYDDSVFVQRFKDHIKAMRQEWEEERCGQSVKS